MIDFLQQIDQWILLAFNGHHTAAMDRLMMLISDRYVWFPFYGLLLLLMLRSFGWRRTLVYTLAIAMVIWATDQLCASVIRPAVGRLRPSNLDNPLSALITVVDGYRSGSYSFPSCHAANTFALATFMSLLWRRRGITWAFMAWAVVVSCSRLYLGVHYPSDLLAGALIGSAIAVAVYRIMLSLHLKWLAAGALLLALPCQARAEGRAELKWNLDFGTVFDNREGDATYTPTRTYFFTRLAPEIGVAVDSGRHSVMGGAVWTQPIGCEWDGHRISPTLYYQFRTRTLRFGFGMVPKRHLLRPLPNYIESDSVSYFQRNVRGALLTWRGRNGLVQGVVDWRGMQGPRRREAFDLIVDGEWHRPGSLLMAGGLVMLNHLAKQSNPPDDQYVVDNLVANPYVGLDLSALTHPVDTLQLRAGALASLTRDRADSRWLSAAGLWVDLHVSWWRLGLHNTLYLSGRPLFPLYGKFGALLNEGEPFYAGRYYNRTSLTGRLIDWRGMITLHASLDFNVAPQSFNFYQRLILKFYI